MIHTEAISSSRALTTKGKGCPALMAFTLTLSVDFARMQMKQGIIVLNLIAINIFFIERFYNGVIVKVGESAVAKHSSPLTRAKSVKKVICYFSNWAGLRDGDGKFIPENVNAKLCSHIVYAFAKLDEESLTMTPSGPRSDLDDGYYARLQSIVKKQNPDAKVLISVGGWADSAGDKYSRLVNSGEARANFVKQAIKFLKLYGFDGLVMEWHFPVCWQSDCSKGPNSDKQGFAALAQELKKDFKEHNFTVGGTLSGYKQVIDVAYDVKSLGDSLDFMNIMTYDFRGFWDGKTGHHAPLYVDNDDTNTDYNTVWTRYLYFYEFISTFLFRTL